MVIHNKISSGKFSIQQKDFFLKALNYVQSRKNPGNTDTTRSQKSTAFPSPNLSLQQHEIVEVLS